MIYEFTIVFLPALGIGYCAVPDLLPPSGYAHSENDKLGLYENVELGPGEHFQEFTQGGIVSSLETNFNGQNIALLGCPNIGCNPFASLANYININILIYEAI